MVPSPVEPDHAGRDTRQHRLHELAPLGQLIVGVDELGALVLQLLGHRVEVERQAAQVAFAAQDRQLDPEVAARHLLGRADQAADGSHEQPREPEAHPDGRQQRGQRDHEIEKAVRELQATARAPQFLVGGDALVAFGAGGRTTFGSTPRAT